jgi:hypothetical protein
VTWIKQETSKPGSYSPQSLIPSGSKDPSGCYIPHRVPWPQDHGIHLDPTPLTGFCGLRIAGSTWILHPSQSSVASGSKDPPGSNTSQKVLWPQDLKIHPDPTLLTGFCGLRIEGSTWIRHPLQGSVAWGSKDPPGSYTPTGFCGLRLKGSTWILHLSQGSVASGSNDPPGSYTPHRVLWPQHRRIHLDPTPLTGFCGLRIAGSTCILHPSQGSVASG